MLFLYFSGLLFLIASISFVMNSQHKFRSEAWVITIQTSITIGVISLWLGSIVTGICWYLQIRDLENIEKFTNCELIYKDKATELTAEFSKYLAQAYPEHEKAIFDSISPNDVEIYLVKYPELRSSDTILALTAEINQLQSDTYDQRLKKEEAKADIRIRLRNPWLMNFVIPDK